MIWCKPSIRRFFGYAERRSPLVFGEGPRRYLYRASSALQINGLRQRIRNRWQFLLNRLERFQNGEERFRRCRLDAQPRSLLSYDGVFSGKLELARNARSAIPTIFEDFDVTLSAHFVGLCLSICHANLICLSILQKSARRTVACSFANLRQNAPYQTGRGETGKPGTKPRKTVVEPLPISFVVDSPL